MNPNNLQAQMMLGNASLAKGDIAKASKTFEGAVRLAPQNPIGYFQVGRVLLIQKKGKEALVQLEKALSLQPDYLEALNLVVAIQLSQKDHQKAIARVEAQIRAARTALQSDTARVGEKMERHKAVAERLEAAVDALLAGRTARDPR